MKSGLTLHFPDPHPPQTNNDGRVTSHASKAWPRVAAGRLVGLASQGALNITCVWFELKHTKLQGKNMLCGVQSR